jgi:hypothetical protein
MVTAIGVYTGEAQRAAFEKLRYTHEAYSRYIDYQETRRGDHTRCLDYLIDPAKITDQEFDELFLFSPQYIFKYEPTRHSGLLEACFGGNIGGTTKTLFHCRS